MDDEPNHVLTSHAHTHRTVFLFFLLLVVSEAAAQARCVQLRTPFVTSRRETWTGATVKIINYAALSVPAGDDRFIRSSASGERDQ